MSFQWPVEGEIIETFGPKQGGRRNDGINIAAPEGAPFRAAAAGDVAYAGNEIPGYGWLVLVRHEGGVITAYAHARALRVQEGDRVRAGQVLGEVGSSGRVSRPQLHFEIRRGVTPIDPLRELPRRPGA
jgi:murein DD-endopeptidase MepM/ murein hydrolase activator NlpD